MRARADCDRSEWRAGPAPLSPISGRWMRSSCGTCPSWGGSRRLMRREGGRAQLPLCAASWPAGVRQAHLAHARARRAHAPRGALQQPAELAAAGPPAVERCRDASSPHPRPRARSRSDPIGNRTKRAAIPAPTVSTRPDLDLCRCLQQRRPPGRCGRCAS
eukprot:7377564-Prymnesium_polylepis.2